MEYGRIVRVVEKKKCIKVQIQEYNMQFRKTKNWEKRKVKLFRKERIEETGKQDRIIKKKNV